MNRWIRFSGILGFVIFALGIIGALITGGFTHPLMLGHMSLGVALMLVWVLLVGARNPTKAGDIVRGRTVRFGANVLLYSAVVIGLIVVANLAGRHFDKRFDLTEQGVYSLSPQTVSVLSNLTAPLKLVGFKNPQGGGSMDPVVELLNLFKSQGASNLTTEVIDPRTKPQAIDTYGMKPGNAIYLQYGSGDQQAVSRINETTEEALTNAIIKLTRGAARKVYVVQGHNEPDLAGAGDSGLKLFADAAADEHLQVTGLFLGQTGAVPEDAGAVVLISPKRPIPESERSVLVKYVESGGRLLMMGDPRTTEDVKAIADKFGITVGNDVVIDQIQRLFAAPQLGAQPIVRDYSTHAITRSLTPQHITIFNIASSVAAKAPSPEGATVTELIKSSASAWGETNLVALFDSGDPAAELDPVDLPGPVPMAVAYEKEISTEGKAAGAEATFEKSARLVVFGDSDWILNSNFGIYANRDMVMNALNWLVGEEGGVTLRPKSIRSSTAPISQDTFIRLFALSFVIPELFLLLGLIIWWYRRTSYV